jgi:hypothetical protein
MFSRPFSFEGRIRRTEYGITFLFYVVVLIMLKLKEDNPGIYVLLYIPLLWLLWAQGAKRCHDLGLSGWYQIIPFYFLWLIFEDGKPGTNEYGDNPKDVPGDQFDYTHHPNMQGGSRSNPDRSDENRPHPENLSGENHGFKKEDLFE